VGYLSLLSATLDVHGRLISLPGLVLLGLLVGYGAGMFGVGGGFLLVPLMSIMMHVPIDVAASSGLAQIIAVAVAAFMRHRELGNGEPRVDLLMLGGSLLGVDAGARLLAALTELGTWEIHGHSVRAVRLVLQVGYMLLLAAVAATMIRESRRPTAVRAGDAPLARLSIPPFVNLPRAGLRQISVPLIAYLGFGMGLASGLLGIGGGVALLPILIYGFGFTTHMAAGTGILVLLLTAIAGTIVHALHGTVHLGIVVALMLGGTLGAQAGALTTRRLNWRQMRFYFALMVLLTVLAIAWDLVRRLE
jgi:uncharacterized membrane protein YfcA